jgi:hypothetical protein
MLRTRGNQEVFNTTRKLRIPKRGRARARGGASCSVAGIAGMLVRGCVEGAGSVQFGDI